MPECGVCYEEYRNLKTLYACKHEICKSCYPRILETSTRLGMEASCPFCRTLIKEVNENFELEYWLNLEPAEWNVISTTTNNGTEIIRTYKKNETNKSWRNNDKIIFLKRHKQRKKYIKNKKKDE